MSITVYMITMPLAAAGVRARRAYTRQAEECRIRGGRCPLNSKHWLRYVLAWDHGLCRAVLAVYVQALLGFSAGERADSVFLRAGAGSRTVIQRFGGALNLNTHFHTLVLDGVFTSRRSMPCSGAASRDVRA